MQHWHTTTVTMFIWLRNLETLHFDVRWKPTWLQNDLSSHRRFVSGVLLEGYP